MKAPAWLDKQGRSKWREIVAGNPQLTEKDGDTLALLCQSWSTYLTATGIVTKDGINLAGPNGMVRVNPAVNVANEAWKQILKASKVLGLTPDKQPADDVPDELEI